MVVDGIVSGGTARRASPAMVANYHEYLAEDYHRIRALAQTDLVGIAIHCAKDSSTCAAGQTDALPDEPRGYTGFKGLFGAQAINPLLTGQPAPVAVTATWLFG